MGKHEEPLTIAELRSGSVRVTKLLQELREQETEVVEGNKDTEPEICSQFYDGR